MGVSYFRLRALGKINGGLSDSIEEITSGHFAKVVLLLLLLGIIHSCKSGIVKVNLRVGSQSYRVIHLP